jgi:FdhD protein
MTEIMQGAQTLAFDETVISEETLEICLNGEPVAVQWRTPGHDAELAAGFCLTTGLLPLENLATNNLLIELNGKASMPGAARVDVRTQAPRAAAGRIHTLDQALSRLAPLGAGATTAAETIWAMHQTLMDNQQLWSETGGAHAAGLFHANGSPIIIREDVGRHNALDKVIGHGLLNGIPLPECVLALSSRASFEMALKAAQAGFSIVACVSAATSTAVRLCHALNITMAGFVRKNRMVVYTHPERISGN